MIDCKQIRSRELLLRAILTKPKKLKSMKQELKFFRAFPERTHAIYRTSFQACGLSTINASQMMDISFNWAIKDFPCWKVSRTNQSLLYKYLQISIYRGQTHSILYLVQFSMQFLTTQFILTFLEFIKQVFLTLSDFRLIYSHWQDLPLSSLKDHTESLA